MPNKTKKTIVADVVEKTGVTPSKAKQALETVLGATKRALANGNKVDLEKLGKLKMVSRNPVRRITRNLKNRLPTIETINKKHPKTVRLLGGKDLLRECKATLDLPIDNDSFSRQLVMTRYAQELDITLLELEALLTPRTKG